MTSKEFRKNCDAVLDLYRDGSCDTQTFIDTMRQLVAERDKTLDSLNDEHRWETVPATGVDFDWGE